MNPAGSKVEAWLVTFQSVLYHVRSLPYAHRLHMCCDAHSLLNTRKVLTFVPCETVQILLLGKIFMMTTLLL